MVDNPPVVEESTSKVDRRRPFHDDSKLPVRRGGCSTWEGGPLRVLRYDIPVYPFRRPELLRVWCYCCRYHRCCGSAAVVAAALCPRPRPQVYRPISVPVDNFLPECQTTRTRTRTTATGSSIQPQPGHMWSVRLHHHHHLVLLLLPLPLLRQRCCCCGGALPQAQTTGIYQRR